MTPAAVDGPLLANTTLPLTVLPATAVGGTLTLASTSASGEIAVVADDVSGSVFDPWLVVVPMVDDTVTDPLVGAVYATPRTRLTPEPRLVGIPVNVTAPLPTLYDAVAPPGRPVNATPANPGVRPSVYVTPAAVDGPLFAYVTVPLTVLAAIALAGNDVDVVTSASGEIAVVAVAVSGSVFGPWLVDVPISPATTTDPVAGAVYWIPIAMLEPAPRVVGIPVKLTAPLAGT